MPQKSRPLSIARSEGRQIRNLSPSVVVILTKVPKPPAGISRSWAKKKLWTEICKSMIARETLTGAGLVAVEAYVHSVMLMRHVMENKRAEIAQKLAALRETRVAAAELGLTPSSHAKVERPEGVFDNDQEREAADLIA